MRNITLTGVDERTPIDSIINLAMLGAEIGFLYTHSPDGRNRYPSKEWILEVMNEVSSAGKCALHICGKRAKAELLDDGVSWATDYATRIQVNGVLKPEELGAICNMFKDTKVITQHTEANAHLLTTEIENHSLLVDSSGGQGKLPQAWRRPDTTKDVGFAGGLGPKTLAVELHRIATVAKGDWWVDMEGNLRTEDDWFSMDKAMEVLRIWNASFGQLTCDREDRKVSP